MLNVIKFVPKSDHIITLKLTYILFNLVIVRNIYYISYMALLYVFVD